MSHPPLYDLCIIGGGINGVGVARDAAGRGLSVVLCEKGDFASATSSASSKLIHGGLRYLEHYEFRLVREALSEREVLLRIAPHLITPKLFVLPHSTNLRPRWILRTGLFLYDHLGGKTTLPKSRAVELKESSFGGGLQPLYQHGFIYSDCWVDDARLVIANALDAAAHGATLCPRTSCLSACRTRDFWILTLRDELTQETHDIQAKIVINAAGPWVLHVLNEVLDCPARGKISHVQGSHIVVPKLYEGEHALILQNNDARVIFVIPFEEDYSLIGTTDVVYQRNLDKVDITPAEISYLCESVNRYFVRSITPEDVVWSYSGVRPLYDDGRSNPSEITRDYVLELNDEGGYAPVLSLFGGKITTYRRLSLAVLEKLKPYFPTMKGEWTDRAPLPGGEMGIENFPLFIQELKGRYASFPVSTLQRLAHAYGLRVDRILGKARHWAELGMDFGGTLTKAEVTYLIEEEWARTAEDILWRRTKCGLKMTPKQRESLGDFVVAYLGEKQKEYLMQRAG